MQFLRTVAMALVIIVLTGCNEETDTVLHISPAGHSFAFLPMPDAKTVSVQVIWPMPWALNDANNPAVSHLGVKMILFGGAVDVPEQTLQARMSDLGAEAFLLQAGVTLRTVINAPPQGLDKAVTLVNSLLRTPALPADLLEPVRQAAAESRAEVYTRPAEQAFLALRQLVMQDQPNYSESMSFADTGLITSVKLADIQRWHAETLVGQGALIAVAGPVDIAAAGAAVDLLMAGLPDRAAPVGTVKPMDLGPRRILLHVPTADTTLLAVIASMPPTGDAGEMNDIIGSYILGGDDQALLAKAVSARIGSTVSITTAIDAFSRENRILVMSGQISPGQTATVAETVANTYRQMAATPPQQAEVNRWTAHLATNLTAMQNDPVNRAGAMLEAMQDGNTPMMILELDAMLAKVTPDTVQQRFADAYPLADDLIFVAVSSDAAALPGACIILQPQDVFDCP